MEVLHQKQVSSRYYIHTVCEDRSVSVVVYIDTTVNDLFTTDDNVETSLISTNNNLNSRGHMPSPAEPVIYKHSFRCSKWPLCFSIQASKRSYIIFLTSITFHATMEIQIFNKTIKTRFRGSRITKKKKTVFVLLFSAVLFFSYFPSYSILISTDNSGIHFSFERRLPKWNWNVSWILCYTLYRVVYHSFVRWNSYR